MNAPATIGEQWTPKRGHRDAGQLEIRMIHRADRAVTVYTSAGDRRTSPGPPPGGTGALSLVP